MIKHQFSYNLRYCSESSLLAAVLWNYSAKMKPQHHICVFLSVTSPFILGQSFKETLFNAFANKADPGSTMFAYGDTIYLILHTWAWQVLSFFYVQTWKLIYVIIHSGWSLAWIFMKEKVYNWNPASWLEKNWLAVHVYKNTQHDKGLNMTITGLDKQNFSA